MKGLNARRTRRDALAQMDRNVEHAYIMNEEPETDVVTAAGDPIPLPVLPICLYGNPVLLQPAEKVGVFNTPELLALLERMFRTMYDASGVGLAAPQIGVSKRIAVIDVSGAEVMDRSQMLVLINPEIIERSDELGLAEEGCLSLPSFHGKVKRPLTVTVRSQNYLGEWTEAKGEGLLARALCHEIDHLDGKLFIDHLSVLKRDLITTKIRRYKRAGIWKS